MTAYAANKVPARHRDILLAGARAALLRSALAWVALRLRLRWQAGAPRVGNEREQAL